MGQIMERKLAAIVVTDIAGFSSIAGKDEKAELILRSIMGFHF